MDTYLRFYLLASFLLFPLLFNAQDLDFDDEPGNTYALIIGVSEYEDEGIPTLNFAHRDAEAFSDYLQSTAGGSVPKKHIKLLTNKAATIGAIDEGIFWLASIAKEGDLAIFFFSGHGDTETKFIEENGYLIAHNTPKTNYRRQAIALRDIDELAVNLSAKKKARTMMILDACRAGKLAGTQINGNALANDQASERKANEVRILSCKSDQQSWESPTLGGGRGVFSYYLINGMIGMAENDDDGKVSFLELSFFTKPKVKKQANKLSKNQKRQEPIFEGFNDDFVVAKIDPDALAKAQAQPEEIGDGNGFAAIDKGISRTEEEIEEAPIEILIEELTTEQFLDSVDFSKVLALDSTEIVSFFLDRYYEENKSEPTDLMKIKEPTAEELKREADAKAKTYYQFPVPNDIAQEEPAIDTTSISDFDEIVADSVQRAELGRLLAIKLHDRGQEIINQYLTGDTVELKRRKYYSEHKGNYNNYADMFAVAMHLLPKAHPSYPKLEIKHHYFKGVAARILMPTMRNRDSLLRIAEFHQNKAYDLDGHQAAYISNEMANIAVLKGENKEAVKYYVKAREQAPMWAIPWANMAHLCYKVGKEEEGRILAEKARELQPDLSSANTALGKIYLQQKDFLKAEEYFRRASELEERHWFPFEELGKVYLQNTQYELADSFFLEAEKRKQGLFHLEAPAYEDVWLNDLSYVVADTLSYEVDRDDKTILAEFARGVNAYGLEQFDLAERRFRAVAKQENNHPLAYHFLGKMFLKQNRYEEAEMMLKYALEFHLSETDFENYISKTQNQIDKKPKQYSVGTEVYTESYTGKKVLYYLLADLYKEWKHFKSAEETYLKIIEFDSEDQAAHEALWTLYESLERYEETEAAIKECGSIWEDDLFYHLNDFYTRMNKKLPNNADWFYKKGLLQFDRFKEIYAEHGVQGRVPIGSSNNPYWSVLDIEKSLLKALSLEPNHYSRTDINLKLGDLKLMSLEPTKAAEYFENAIAFEPTHAEPRLTATEIYDSHHRFQEALVHLDYLMDSSQINYTNRLRYTDYMIRSSRFSEAENLLFLSEDFDLIERPERIELYAKKALNSGQPQKAIDFYTKKSSLTEGNVAANVRYSIARAKMDLGKQKEAFADLEKLLAEGFDVPFVLKFDEKWAALRENPEWKILMAKYPSKDLIDTNF